MERQKESQNLLLIRDEVTSLFLLVLRERTPSASTPPGDLSQTKSSSSVVTQFPVFPSEGVKK